MSFIKIIEKYKTVKFVTIHNLFYYYSNKACQVLKITGVI